MTSHPIEATTTLPTRPPKIGLAVIGLVTFNVVFSVVMAWFFGARVVAAEDAPIENLQAAVLLLAVVLFLLASVRHGGAARMLCFGLAVFSVVLVLREYEPMGSGPLMDYMRSHRFRWHEAIAVVAIALVYMIARWRYVPVIARYFLSRGSVYFYLAAVFVVVSSGFEKLEFEFVEEVLEANGYIVHCLMAVAWLALIPRQKPGE